MKNLEFSFFWTRLNKEAAKEYKKRYMDRKLQTEIMINQNCWRNFVTQGTTTAGDRETTRPVHCTKVTHRDYLSKGNVELSK